MQDNSIQGWQITRTKNSGSGANNARLYGVSPGWIDSNRTSKMYIDLAAPEILVGIITQGCSTEQAWVTSYKLRYKFESSPSWSQVQENGIPTVFISYTQFIQSWVGKMFNFYEFESKFLLAEAYTVQTALPCKPLPAGKLVSFWGFLW